MWWVLEYFEHTVFAFCVIVLVQAWVASRHRGLVVLAQEFMCLLPGVRTIVDAFVKKEVGNFVRQVTHSSGLNAQAPNVQLPKKGIPYNELRQEMEALRKSENILEKGKVFAYVYTLPDDHFKLQKECFSIFEEPSDYSVDHDLLVKEFHQAFLHENALNPMVFPSLRRFELEIISMTSGLLNGDSNVCGFLTSGGTESVMMAVKTYRDRARKLFPYITRPEIVAPITAHPCIDKAAHYFGLRVIHTPTKNDHTADVVAMKKAITKSTILLVGSAPQFCHGIVDPIAELSYLAVQTGLPLHVDACFGGFMLPWDGIINCGSAFAPGFHRMEIGTNFNKDFSYLSAVEKLGYSLPVFDFRLPGVTSMSADIHKYGYGAKGSSLILYRNEDIRRYQIYSYSNWPGGLYGSPSMAGSRPGGNIAASWVAMRALGEEGYLLKAKQLMQTTEKLKKGISEVEELEIVGNPHMTAFAVKSVKNLDILDVADKMETRGWVMERLHNPTCFHISVLPHHIGVADEFLTDLADSVIEVKNENKVKKSNSAALYGMMASITDRTIVDEFIVEFFSQMYQHKTHK